MPRFALKIEYDGRPFSGWQRQADRPSVQEAVERALRRLEPGAPGIAAAGRTDTGVHAFGQVAHCDLDRDWDPFRLSEALNHHLKPDPVAIRDAARARDSFHARFSAVERRYLYRVVVRRSPLAVERGQVWRVPHPLSVDFMTEAAAHLEGSHDFTTFRAALCQANSPVKTLDEVRIESVDSLAGWEIRFFFRARSFLHHQVRSMVGTLEKAGSGTWSPEAVADALAAADRSRCGPVAPPDGLYLAGVGYPEDPFDA